MEVQGQQDWQEAPAQQALTVLLALQEQPVPPESQDPQELQELQGLLVRPDLPERLGL